MVSVAAGRKVERAIIIGSGPVGIHTVRLLAAYRFIISAVVFSSEFCKPNNKVLLSDYIAGHIEKSSIYNTDDLLDPKDNKIEIKTGCTIVKAIPDKNCVVDQFGNEKHYSKLTLATGAPLTTIPSIIGISNSVGH